MMKYTKGPWNIDKENCHAGQVAVCYGNHTYWEIWSPNWTVNNSQALANAHLIAAAPDLYEAAITAADWLCEAEEGSDPWERGQALRHAIAKASGGPINNALLL